MRKLAAALLAALPLAAAAQDAQPAPAPAQAAPAQAAPAPAPAAAAAQPAAPQYPPQYAPPPQYTPPPPQAQPAQYAPPPQYAPPAQYPPQYAPAPVPARSPYQRDGWYIGFGLGGGGGSVKLPAGPFNSGGSMSFEEYLGPSPMTLALNIKLGATLSPRVLLGLDITAVRSEADDQGLNAALQISTYNAMLTFFPVGRGFFVRGGAGLAVFSYDVSDGSLSLTNSVGGLNLTAGVGYAFWLGRSFNLTVNLDVAAQSYGDKNDPYGALPTSSSMTALGLGFDWY